MAEIAASLERAAATKSKSARTRQRARADRLLRVFLERLRKFTVLDPACQSGNFLYLALHTLKDLEHRIELEAEAMGLVRVFPTVSPTFRSVPIGPRQTTCLRSLPVAEQAFCDPALTSHGQFVMTSI